MLRQKNQGTHLIISHNLMLGKVNFEKNHSGIFLKNRLYISLINQVWPARNGTADVEVEFAL